MLVDVFQLRLEGVKLHPDVVRARGATRGWLTVKTTANKSIYPNEEPWLTNAFVDEQKDGGWPHVLALAKVVVKRRTDRGVLLHGRQEYGSPGAMRSWPQAWWCRAVGDAGEDTARDADPMAPRAVDRLPTPA